MPFSCVSYGRRISEIFQQNEDVIFFSTVPVRLVCHCLWRKCSESNRKSKIFPSTKAAFEFCIRVHCYMIVFSDRLYNASFCIRFIRRDQKKRRNGKACRASPTYYWSGLINWISKDTNTDFYLSWTIRTF